MVTERTALTQIVQIGAETTPGTGVPATKLMTAMDFESRIQGTVDEFRPAGFKYPTVLATEREWVELTMKGQPTYSELIYVFSSLLNIAQPSGASNPSALNGAGKLWAFESNANTPDTPQTYTIEQGSSVRAHKMVGGIFSDFTLSFSREKVEMGGKMLGQRLTDGIILSGTAFTSTFAGTNGQSLTAMVAGTVLTAAGSTAAAPSSGLVTVVASGGTATLSYTGVSGSTFTGIALVTGTGSWTVTTGAAIAVVATSSIPLVPIQANQLTAYLDSTSGGLGTTKIAAASDTTSRLLSGEFSLTNRYGPIWPVDASLGSYANTVEIVPTLTFKLVVEANAAGMGILTDWRNNTTKFLRLQAVGAVMTGSTDVYKATFDVAVKPRMPQAFSDQQGVFAIEYEMAGVYDSGWGKAFHVELQNLQTGL